MKTVAISVAGEPAAIEQFLERLKQLHPLALFCPITQTARCRDLLVIFPSELSEDELGFFEFQHGRDVQTGFVVREKT